MYATASYCINVDSSALASTNQSLSGRRDVKGEHGASACRNCRHMALVGEQASALDITR